MAAPSSRAPAGRSRWVWIGAVIVALVIIGVVAYFILYPSGGSGSGGGGTGGGGYLVFAFSADHIRRLRKRLRRTR